jgi:hypothetical protein
MKPEKSYLLILTVAAFGLLAFTGCRMTDGEPHKLKKLVIKVKEGL